MSSETLPRLALDTERRHRDTLARLSASDEYRAAIGRPPVEHHECEHCGTSNGVQDHGLGYPLCVWLCDDCAATAAERQAERRGEA